MRRGFAKDGSGLWLCCREAEAEIQVGCYGAERNELSSCNTPVSLNVRGTAEFQVNRHFWNLDREV